MDRLVVALGAFAGGLAVGLLVAPSSGERTRRVARVGARRGSRWLSHQVRLTRAGILEAGDEAAARFKLAAEEAVDRYIPDLLGDDDEWQDVYTKTAKDVEDEKR